jgi:hypothetical protein
MGNSIPSEKVGAEVEVTSISCELPAPRITVIATNRVEGTVPLPEAEKVVSAGRGMKGPENWGMIEKLAQTMGATTACSRPVADTGWRPHHEHVGQTGIAIRPNLYIAIGISGAKQSFELKLKAQHFFKTAKTLPLVNQPGYNFTFKKKEQPTPPKTLQSLAKSTKIPRKQTSGSKDELLEKADFSIELDLHYEALPQQELDRRNPPSILKYQLEVFDQYIAKAKNLGIEKVFIIHGVGAGVLKKALQDRMQWNPAVTKFTNEYHPKYGFGATEVYLR